MASSSNTALKSFSLTNDILTVSPQDEIYRFDVEKNKQINKDAPWTKESVEQQTLFAA
jgi:COP9 signalosome complex subunit 5